MVPVGHHRLTLRFRPVQVWSYYNAQNKGAFVFVFISFVFIMAACTVLITAATIYGMELFFDGPANSSACMNCWGTTFVATGVMFLLACAHSSASWVCYLALPGTFFAVGLPFLVIGCFKYYAELRSCNKLPLSKP